MKAQLRVGFQGRGKAETFSRARVQSLGDGVQLALGISGQVRTLGQVLAQQAIGVLVGATLPRRMRIGKEDLERKSLRQLLVLGHLFAAITRQSFPQWSGEMPKFICEAFRTLLASVPSIQAKTIKRVARSTKVSRGDLLRAPLMRSSFLRLPRPTISLDTHLAQDRRWPPKWSSYSTYELPSFSG